MSKRKRPTRGLRTKAALQAIIESAAAHGDGDAQTYLARERMKCAPVELTLFATSNEP